MQTNKITKTPNHERELKVYSKLSKFTWSITLFFGTIILWLFWNLPYFRSFEWFILHGIQFQSLRVATVMAFFMGAPMQVGFLFLLREVLMLKGYKRNTANNVAIPMAIVMVFGILLGWWTLVLMLCISAIVISLLPGKATATELYWRRNKHKIINVYYNNPQEYMQHWVLEFADQRKYLSVKVINHHKPEIRRIESSWDGYINPDHFMHLDTGELSGAVINHVFDQMEKENV